MLRRSEVRGIGRAGGDCMMQFERQAQGQRGVWKEPNEDGPQGRTAVGEGKKEGGREEK